MSERSRDQRSPVNSACESKLLIRWLDKLEIIGACRIVREREKSGKPTSSVLHEQIGLMFLFWREMKLLWILCPISLALLCLK